MKVEEELSFCEMRLTEAVEKLYHVFNKYTTANMHYCDCGCIDLEDVKKMASKKLRELEEDDFSSYHGSALYTWGNLEHYKHFLPRFFEVYSQKRGRALIDIYDIGIKLEYAEWTKWEASEKKAIHDFVLTDWIDFVHNHESEIGKFELENYSRLLGIDTLFKWWNLSLEDKSLKNFVTLFYYNGTTILNGRFKVNDENIASNFIDLINQVDLTERLENEFFDKSQSDTEYAARVSIVLQMIEQAMANNKD